LLETLAVLGCEREIDPTSFHQPVHAALSFDVLLYLVEQIDEIGQSQGAAGDIGGGRVGGTLLAACLTVQKWRS
jgi:hypothetical protein